ncbi:hypothetical protein K438DRAFT_2003518 [Mycena galopus ATCC 62051]|nr:hypothetical protein K438DRAFT_2004224 [Mycena galopus ATCC 62051]KAF8123382.1 hypothetical protein K438DRAFT_2003518 [Mycena galopus ATCC 62051]
MHDSRAAKQVAPRRPGHQMAVDGVRHTTCGQSLALLVTCRLVARGLQGTECDGRVVLGTRLRASGMGAGSWSSALQGQIPHCGRIPFYTTALDSGAEAARGLEKVGFQVSACSAQAGSVTARVWAAVRRQCVASTSGHGPSFDQGAGVNSPEEGGDDRKARVREATKSEATSGALSSTRKCVRKVANTRVARSIREADVAQAEGVAWTAASGADGAFDVDIEDAWPVQVDTLDEEGAGDMMSSPGLAGSFRGRCHNLEGEGTSALAVTVGSKRRARKTTERPYSLEERGSEHLLGANTGSFEGSVYTRRGRGPQQGHAGAEAAHGLDERTRARAAGVHKALARQLYLLGG